MKKTRLTALLLLVTMSSVTFSQNVGIGTENPNESALLDLNPPNNDKGLLLPRLTENERDGIPNPAESLWIFNTDSQCYEGYSTQESKWFPVGCLEEPASPPDPTSPFVCDGELTDTRDGNTYKTVQIGNQCWMAENLAYLPEVHSNAQFQTQGDNNQPGYGVYDYDGNDVTAAKSQAHYATYGVLYNWAAVMQGEGSSLANPSGVQGICPEDWHVPSDAEWKEMEIHLGMTSANADATGLRNTGNVGTQLKTSAWNGTNTSGFTALPGGSRRTNGTFFPLGTSGVWRSASESGTNAFARTLNSSNVGVTRSTSTKFYGFSLRCVLD